MNTYIGIDLGTSGVKLLLVSASGKIIAETSKTYNVLYPNLGWTEQNPEDWWRATLDGLTELLAGQNTECIKGISFGGQMHGLVVLDKEDKVIRPCILWNDGRTEKQTTYLNEKIGKDKLSEYTGNIAFAGFTAPKLLWLRENEPDNFRRIAKIMLPKDYLAYRLSGAFCTDYSDASGTLLLDVKNKCWSEEMLNICDISEDKLPDLRESYGVAGLLKNEIAERYGLSDTVKVIVGAGDNAAAAIGMGTVDEEDCNISLGTSGTIFIPQDTFSMDGANALHSFAHANGKWHLLGCILSAASCRSWWLEKVIGKKDYAADEKGSAQADTTGLYFLPYLSGERSPHNDVHAKGAFIGLTSTTTREQMSKAVMEGVAFALRDCMEVARKNGAIPARATICGGGAQSNLWRQITADILNLPLYTASNKQGASYGAAILAMVGNNEYKDVAAACKSILCKGKASIPIKENIEYYNKKYEIFKKLYPALKNII